MSLKNHKRILSVGLTIVSIILIILPVSTSWTRTVRAEPVLQDTLSPSPTIKFCHICDDDIVSESASPVPVSTHTNSQETPIVQLLLFWMDGCPHCHEVLDNVLPPLEEKYGPQLQITLVEIITQEDINGLFDIGAAYGFPKEQIGVPFLIIGDQVLIGSDQIPAELPGLIEFYLAEGGVSLPEIPEINDLVPEDSGSEENCAPEKPCSKPDLTNAPLVIGVLFTTPDCHDCQLISGLVLKLAREEYEGQFAVETVDIVTSADVDYLYQVAAQFGLTSEEVELPLLILGDQILVNEDISTLLPDLIESILRAGGTAPVRMPTPSGQSEDLLVKAAPTRPEGFWIAIGTLVFMISALIYSLIRIARAMIGERQPGKISIWQSWAIPLLALVGLGVAWYLAYVETQTVSAVCGPVGDCNSVQSSPYARLFGVLPIGILGMAGYLGILIVWGWDCFRQDKLSGYAPLILYGMSFSGTFFSLYLTYLEPFVIKAVCMWCISSAIIMTLLLLLSLNSAIRVIKLNSVKARNKK